MNRPKADGYWEDIIDKNPAIWGAAANPALTPLTAGELEAATKGCMFPVHAMGYNWLQSNARSAKVLAERIQHLILTYKGQGFTCEKVILITHSMGGLVARALIHPKMGNLKDQVLGIVHGVMPALGAPAAYRRMRCGFEEGSLRMNPAPKFLGNSGNEVTAVLGNSPGGLQLLPSCAYGNGWLEVRKNGILLDQFPKNGDPYQEIYCLRGKWFGLLREEWLNPANNAYAGLTATIDLLQDARQFHLDIADTFHEQSYGHYGADTLRASWERIVWNLSGSLADSAWADYRITNDSMKGKLTLAGTTARGGKVAGIHVELGPSQGAGDQTVPLRSSDRQLLSGRFKAIFRQTGYEHQNSYSSTAVLHSTLFSIVRIAATMNWKDDA